MRWARLAPFVSELNQASVGTAAGSVIGAGTQFARRGYVTPLVCAQAVAMARAVRPVAGLAGCERGLLFEPVTRGDAEPLERLRAGCDLGDPTEFLTRLGPRPTCQRRPTSREQLGIRRDPRDRRIRGRPSDLDPGFSRVDSTRR
jgi:hypothetical protein